LTLSRVINPESKGKIRKQLCQSIILAIRKLMQQDQITVESKDIVAYIIFLLDSVYQSIEDSVTAWEKRGYWIKSDRFRMEWEWSYNLRKDLYQALYNEDWDSISQISVVIAQKLNKYNPPMRKKINVNFTDSWNKLMENQQ